MSKAIKKRETGLCRTARIEVLGCKVNQAEAESIAGILEKNGYFIDPLSTEPDLVIINTCCVTSRAEGKSRRLIRKITREFPLARVVVTGCLAEVNSQAIRDMKGNATILGNFEKDHFEDFVENFRNDVDGFYCRGVAHCIDFCDPGLQKRSSRSRAFLKVQDGCHQSCSYCIVPLARGASRSMRPLSVVDHCRALEEAGVREIVLSGIHLGAYGRDLSPRLELEDLLRQLLDACSHVRFRLSSVEPPEITTGLIELVAGNSEMCRHFHIPLQSGDDHVLSRMRRPYDVSSLNHLIGKILQDAPDVCIGFDIIVGFPGEDESAFENTVSLVRNSGAAYVHVFPFSPRPGTGAASLGGRVSEIVIKQRTEKLRALSDTLRWSYYSKFLGKTFSAIVESSVEGERMALKTRTDNYIPVMVDIRDQRCVSGVVEVILDRVSGKEVWGVLNETR